MYNKINNDLKKNIPKFAIFFANFFFIFLIIIACLIIVYSIYRINYGYYRDDINPIFYYSTAGFGAFFLIFSSIGLKKLNYNTKINISILIISTCLPIYCLESYFEIKNILSSKELSNNYDTRSTYEVLSDLNNNDIEAYPNLNPWAFVTTNGLSGNDGNIFPLGGISNITTILPNEGGFYPVIKLDEHGFNNTKGLYIKGKLDAILLGDSFAEGYSVEFDENIAAVLRKMGIKTLNLGKSGNGPLTELATLIEYAKPLEPKVVIWQYYLNDLENELYRELQSKILKNYLNDNKFTQNLILKQNSIDQLLKKYANILLKKEEEKIKMNSQEIKRPIKINYIYLFIKVLKLNNLRSRINLIPKPDPLPKYREQIPIFEEILKKSNDIVTSWGGVLYFLYIPNPGITYSMKNEHENRQKVMNIVNNLQIPIIDIKEEVILKHSNPLSLFPFGITAHFNKEGYQLIGEIISKKINKDL